MSDVPRILDQKDRLGVVEVRTPSHPHFSSHSHSDRRPSSNFLTFVPSLPTVISVNSVRSTSLLERNEIGSPDLVRPRPVDPKDNNPDLDLSLRLTVTPQSFGGVLGNLLSPFSLSYRSLGRLLRVGLRGRTPECPRLLASSLTGTIPLLTPFPRFLPCRRRFNDS